MPAPGSRGQAPMRVVAIRSCAGRWPRSLVTGLFSAEVAVGCSGRLLTAGSARSVADGWTGYRSSGSPASCHRVLRTPGGGSSSWRHWGAGACRRPGRCPRRVSESPGPGGGRRGVATASDGGSHLVASWPGGGHCGATCDHIGATNSPYEGIVALLWPVWSVRGLSVVSRRPAGDYAHGDSLPGGLQLAVLWPEGDHRGDAGLVVVS